MYFKENFEALIKLLTTATLSSVNTVMYLCFSKSDTQIKNCATDPGFVFFLYGDLQLKYAKISDFSSAPLY